MTALGKLFPIQAEIWSPDLIDFGLNLAAHLIGANTLKGYEAGEQFSLFLGGNWKWWKASHAQANATEEPVDRSNQWGFKLAV